MMKLFKNKRAQNVAEYAILIALVVGAIIAIQKLAQRTLQARVRDASQFLTDNTDFGSSINSTISYNTGQYEPYYQNTMYDTTRDDAEQKGGSNATETYGTQSTTTRAMGGYSNVTFPGQGGTVSNGMTF